MIGVDEVGRGALAGPLLVVACRVKTRLPSGLKDSKILSRIARERLALKISNSCDIGPGWATADEIDEYGLRVALFMATDRALTAIKAQKNEKIIIDGPINFASKTYLNASSMVGADNSQPIVSAASIAAKVLRDSVMRQIALDHPGYGFEANVGYGTAEHLKAIKKIGPVYGVHRFSFKQVGGRK